MAIVIMLNNFFHDFAVAILFACLLVMTFIHRHVRGGSAEILGAAYELFRWLNRVVIGCWAFIIVGGIIRTLGYQRYEWMEAAGRGQVTALVIKHILLFSLVLAGTALQLRLRKAFRGYHAKT